MNSMNKTFHILSGLIILFAVITSSLGLFYTTGGISYDFVNQYGDVVKIFGDGIYKNDSYFMAPIFKGTDCTVLFTAIPLFVVALVMDIRKNAVKTKLFLTGFAALFAYYSASISLGVTYNVLHLIYIALFSCSFFALIIGFAILKNYDLKTSVNLYTNGLKIFLIFSGLSLFVAWMPDIIQSLVNKKPLELIEIYTTQITYVLDMGILSPLLFICLYNLKKANTMGYILSAILMQMIIIVGVMVIIQAAFQIRAEIDLPIAALITKVGIFVVMASAAVFYMMKLFKNLKIYDKNAGR